MGIPATRLTLVPDADPHDAVRHLSLVLVNAIHTFGENSPPVIEIENKLRAARKRLAHHLRFT